MDFKFTFEGEETDYDNMLIVEGNTDDIESLTLEMFDPETAGSSIFYIKNTDNLDRLIESLRFIREQENN